MINEFSVVSKQVASDGFDVKQIMNTDYGATTNAGPTKEIKCRNGTVLSLWQPTVIVEEFNFNNHVRK
jgi:hypothetical protein